MMVGEELVQELPAEALPYSSPELPADCGLGCPPGWYGRAELLAFTREGPRHRTLSNGFFVGGFDYQAGGRATIGRRFNCLDAIEVSFVGAFEWDRTAENWSEGGNLQSLFLVGGGLTRDEISAFNDAVFHRQTYATELDNIEVNRKWLCWDVFSSFVGFRYVSVDDDMRFASVDSNGELGVFMIGTDNDLYGAQIGSELMYPYGRLSLSGVGKLGVFLDINRGGTTLINDGIVRLANGVDDSDFSFLAELGISASVRITRCLSVRAGYEFWYIYGLALAAEQPMHVLTAATGLRLDEDGDVFFHGGSAGIELTY
jgi:hypothetical protein